MHAPRRINGPHAGTPRPALDVFPRAALRPPEPTEATVTHDSLDLPEIERRTTSSGAIVQAVTRAPPDPPGSAVFAV